MIPMRGADLLRAWGCCEGFIYGELMSNEMRAFIVMLHVRLPVEVLWLRDWERWRDAVSLRTAVSHLR